MWGKGNKGKEINGIDISRKKYNQHTYYGEKKYLYKIHLFIILIAVN